MKFKPWLQFPPPGVAKSGWDPPPARPAWPDWPGLAGLARPAGPASHAAGPARAGQPVFGRWRRSARCSGNRRPLGPYAPQASAVRRFGSAADQSSLCPVVGKIWGPAVCLGISWENPENLEKTENLNFYCSPFFLNKTAKKKTRSLKLDAGIHGEPI